MGTEDKLRALVASSPGGYTFRTVVEELEAEGHSPEDSSMALMGALQSGVIQQGKDYRLWSSSEQIS